MDQNQIPILKAILVFAQKNRRILVAAEASGLSLDSLKESFSSDLDQMSELFLKKEIISFFKDSRPDIEEFWSSEFFMEKITPEEMMDFSIHLIRMVSKAIG